MKITVIQTNVLLKHIEITKPHNTSLLEIFKKNFININYQCKQGYCGACRTILIKGSVYYFQHMLPIINYKKNEIFPCCCTTNKNITIKIN
ncbi:uncharacterized ferredoxin-like protein [Buchnera aphidicola (Nipponaphis monzeni)]|uniref:Uncharacterized ferredoxin-like protein n=1 Tax=Buchnera aphidicola (Nipponaphis monzeni) TaxID=2495405 RepID=A0A455T9Y3_9GAMM|nr:class I ribonucleotide reductase maintenance protein YfaE [Buchnera aphidicola]BBI01158.1 uncharacterized ferredoxin-like protein [Buchnera aphidicola (Nipponaphis monzeni)]